MSNTNSKNHPVYGYILSCVNENAKEEYNLDKELETDQEKLQFVLDLFRSEYNHVIERKGEYAAFREYLSCLPTSFQVDFENYKILKLARLWNSIPEHATERQEDKILENWFNFITVKFFQLCKRNKVQ